MTSTLQAVLSLSDFQKNSHNADSHEISWQAFVNIDGGHWSRPHQEILKKLFCPFDQL